MSAIDEVVLQAVEADRASVLLVGPSGAAAEALLERCLGALGDAHVVAITAGPAAWARSERAFVVARTFEGADEAAGLLRSALRQDPDALVVQAPAAALPWALLLQAALTGHQLLVHVQDARDEAALEGPRAAGREQGLAPGAALPWLVVVDDEGPARLVAIDGARGDAAEPVWRRGEPPPGALRDLLPRSAPAPLPFDQPELAPLEAARVERLRALVEPHLRAAFVPETCPATGDPARSKLGGLPMLAAGEAWPACACGRPMPLAVQLARGELPPEARACFPEGAGWLQLFYCSSGACDVDDGWTAAAPNKRLRFLAQADAAPASSSAPRFDDAGWEPHDVTAWARVEETPATDDLDDLVAGLDDEAREDRLALSERAASRASGGAAGVEEPVSDDELSRLAGPRAGDKLLGWPHWTQAPEWQRCPRCQARMEPLLQLDAYQGRLELLFAADGTGHVTQCPSHLDELAFAWACG